MRVEDYNALLSSVAAQMSAPDFFPAVMPENDLHPDPGRLQGELIALRRRVEKLEQEFADFAGQTLIGIVSNDNGKSSRR